MRDLILSLLLWQLPPQAPVPPQAPPAILDVWRSDYTACMRDAAVFGRPVLLYFTMHPCPACERLDQVLSSEDLDGFLLLKMDGPGNPELTKAVRVDRYPTLLVLGPDRKILRRHVGYAERAKIQAFLSGQAPQAAPPVKNVKSHTHLCTKCGVEWGGPGHKHNCPKCGRTVTEVYRDKIYAVPTRPASPWTGQRVVSPSPWPQTIAVGST